MQYGIDNREQHPGKMVSYHFSLIVFPIACHGFREKSENRAKRFLVGVSVSQGGASLALGCILLLLQSKFREQNYGKLA